MIIQLAYRRLIGSEKRNGGTYEAATTRRFFKGCTEAIRVVSSESDAWVASMDDSKISAEERKALFDAATKKRITLAKAAGQGQGVDRHLFGEYAFSHFVVILPVSTYILTLWLCV
jgi:carnitine O-acetyltransferase